MRALRPSSRRGPVSAATRCRAGASSGCRLMTTGTVATPRTIPTASCSRRLRQARWSRNSAAPAIAKSRARCGCGSVARLIQCGFPRPVRPAGTRLADKVASSRPVWSAAALTGGCVTASRWATAAVLIAWCLLAVGDSTHAGYYSSVGLALIIVGFVALVVVVAARVPLEVPDRAMLVVPVLVCVGVAIARSVASAISTSPGETCTRSTPSASRLPLQPRCHCWLYDRWREPRGSACSALAAATGIVTIVVINNPGIDVWDLLQQSSTGLLHGDDMYRQHWVHSTGLQSSTPTCRAPRCCSRRSAGCSATSGTGCWPRRCLAPGCCGGYGSRDAAGARRACSSSCPTGLYLINRSWTEPLLVAALAVAIIAMRSGRTGLAIVALAVALACKQHIVLLLPLFALWPSFGLRRTISACGSGAACRAAVDHRRTA